MNLWHINRFWESLVVDLLFSSVNLIKQHWLDIDKIYVQDPFESKYQLLVNGREKVGIKRLKFQKHSLIIQKELIMSMKIWKTLIQQRKVMCW